MEDGALRRPWGGIFGALTWNLSLQAWEAVRLGTHSWWWRLRWEQWRNFAGFDEFAQVHRFQPEGPGSLSPGYAPPITVVHALGGISAGSRFLDLGSGRGIPCLVAAILGHLSHGLEIFPAYVERSQRIADRLSLPARFQQADFEECEWPACDLCWISSSAFSAPLRQRLLGRLLELPPATLIITQDWTLPDPFRLRKMQVLPVSWGTARFTFWQRS